MKKAFQKFAPHFNITHSHRSIHKFNPSVLDSTMASEGDIERYYSAAYDLVIRAGKIFRDGYIGIKDVEVKGASYDLVTQYDSEIEEMLFKGLAKQFPDHKFIGEETAAANKSVPELTDAPTWIIDPIDGTTNFIKKIPHACISVGLAVNKELVVGIIFNPVANELFTAKKGHGAHLNGDRIHVSNVERIQQAVVAYEISLIHAPNVRDKNVKRMYKLGSNATGTRAFGSAALTLCYLAMGRVDCYHIEDLKAWDMAAGAVILREAGGVIYHTSGGKFDVMKPDAVCASSESLCQDMMRLIREANEIQYQFV